MAGNPNSGVYGIDTPYSHGRGAVDDYGRLLPSALQQIWRETAPNFADSRRRILYTNDVTIGKKRAPVPRKHARNRDIYAPLIPHQITGPLHNHNVLGRNEADLKRYTSGTSVTALSRATRIEQWINPLVDKLLSWDELTGMLQDEAEVGALVYPAGADWSRMPPPFRMGGNENDENAPPLPEWWRDSDGRGIEDYLGREHELERGRDPKLTADAYEEALADWELENPAIKVRLVHATDCFPIGLRIDGDGPHIQGLIIRGLYSRNELIRREFIWGRGPILENMTNAGTRDVELYEGWLTDARGLPYVVYSVEGMATRWAGGDGDDWAMIDLHEKYGMNRLMAFYEYGWHRSVRDPDARGIPFGYPTAPGFLAAQSVLGAAIANFWSRGYGARAIKIDANTPREAYMDGSSPKRFTWEPGGDLPIVPGELQDILPQVISPDVWRIIDFCMDSNAQEGPPPGAYGGPGPESGRERTVIRRHIEDAQSQILGGALRVKQKVAIGCLELACNLIKKSVVKRIPVATTIPIATDGKGNQRKGLIVSLDPRDVQGNYALEAGFRPKPGENLALAEQAKGLVQAGLRPRRWFHEEIMGDPSPEQTEAEIVSDAIIYGPDGQADIRELALQIRNDERSEQRKKLREQGRVSPSGTPLAIAGGLAGPGEMLSAAPGGPELAAAGGPGPVGVSAPTSAAGMLGGQVAAGMETQPIRAEQALLAGG